MRVLVCGSRVWSESFIIWTLLDGLQARCEIGKERLVLITGGARGADRCAYEWGMVRLIDENNLEFPADWSRYGRQAGYVRNQQMLDEGNPDLVLAFRSPGKSNGTDMMMDLATKAGIPTYVISPVFYDEAWAEYVNNRKGATDG